MSTTAFLLPGAASGVRGTPLCANSLRRQCAGEGRGMGHGSRCLGLSPGSAVYYLRQMLSKLVNFTGHSVITFEEEVATVPTS